MAGDTETGIAIKYGGAILGGLAAAISGIGGWLFRRIIAKHDEEIDSIKGGIRAVEAKLDSKVDRETWEQHRREARDNLITLHEKVEQIGRDGEQRHRELMHILLERRARGRSADT